MAKKTEEKRFDVSVYLIKASQVSVAESTLFPPSASPQILRDDIPGGKFMALPVDAGAPKWASFVETLLPSGRNVDVLAQTPGGLLWIPHRSKRFLFTFGHAHAKLREEWLEPEFGKKVALSTIPQGQVVEVRAEQVFARWHISSERAPRASAVREFGFESDRDLVAAVEGVPSAMYLDSLGSKVRGGTALRIGLYFSKLLPTLDVIAERFDSNDYKNTWPQVDNLVVVRDALLSASLDKELDTIFGKPHVADRISLAAPAVKSGEKPYPHHFVIGRMGKAVATAPYLLIGNWEAHLRGLGKKMSVATALESPVHLLDESQDEFDTCTMYQCLGTEVSLRGQPFVLSSGVWYEARRDFVKATNLLISSIITTSYALPAWNQVDDEGRYNENAAAADKALWLFDKKLVNFGGGHSRLEFCDLMHLKSRTLYFVKHPSGSASVSHLCEQVRRTAENFFSIDGSFRKKLSTNIVKQNKTKNVSWLANRPKRQEWQLCLVSMGKPADKFPFFAKCGIARLLRELEQGGYNVSFQAV
ncbi:MAG: TIGR04141 family sporadically distributed protein [Burkholderiales bacterium]|nr:TIGR04141 family sporadically distributed protein [Burkholderiales bacterium]